MTNDLEPIQQLLDKHVDRALLKGLYFGVFNTEQDKFFAAAYVPIIKDEYENVSWNLGKIVDNHSLTLPDSQDKRRKYNADGSYQTKSTDECVAEGIYIAYTISFIGCLYKGDWYIMTTLAHMGEGLHEMKAKELGRQYYKDKSFWQSDIFQPYKTYVLKASGKEVKGTEYSQFGRDVPSIVAYELYAQKEAAGRAYRTYINLAICQPFARKLQINFPDEYHEVYPGLMDDFLVMSSEDKKYNLMFARVYDKDGMQWLNSFLYDATTGKMYKWLYATAPCNSFNCQDEIFNCLKDITIIEDSLYLWSHIVTLDDPHFWQEYVFKKEGDNFKYLREIIFN